MRKQPFRAGHLVQWNARMSKDNVPDLVDRVVEAIMHQQGIEFEHTNEYRSNYSYDKLWEQLEHFDRNIVLDKENPYLRYGLKQSLKVFSCPSQAEKLEPVSLLNACADLIEMMGIRDTSAGLTAYGESKLEAFTIGLDKAVDILLGKKVPAPCLAGVRTQRKAKTRLVWQYPLEMIIIEAIVARPLLNYLKRHEGVLTFGDYSHEIGMRMRRSASNSQIRVSLDESQFDSSVNSLFQHFAMRAWRSWFDLNAEVYPGITVGRVFDVIEAYTINAPIVMPNAHGTYPLKVSGIVGGQRSGSYFTVMNDSFTGVTLSFACSMKFNLHLVSDDIYSLGDDLMWFLKIRIDPKDWSDFLNRVSQFMATFGVKMNATKSSVGFATDDAPYLGRVWRNGFPVRMMSEIIRGSLYPENYRRYSPNRAIRQKQALSVVSSYLLTSYVDDPPTTIDHFNQVYFATPWMSSGFTQYLLKEGLVPGDTLRRAIY